MRVPPDNLSPEGARIVERVRCFIRWSADRFDNLDEVHVAIENPVGWRRGKEFWIRPDIWLNDIFEGNAGDSEHAGRVLRDLGLLRHQPQVLQILAKVRGVVKRVYAIDRVILDWSPEVTGRGNRRNRTAGALLSVEDETRLITTPSSRDEPPNLSAKLETAASRALDEALAILQLTPHRDDRVYSAVLRAKTAVIGSVLSTQVRVDEAKLQAKREDALAEHLAVARACALATLGRESEMTEEEVKLVLDGGYRRLDKPPPPGVIERLERMRAGEKPAKGERRLDGRAVFDGDAPVCDLTFDA